MRFLSLLFTPLLAIAAHAADLSKSPQQSRQRVGEKLWLDLTTERARHGLTNVGELLLIETLGQKDLNSAPGSSKTLRHVVSRRELQGIHTLRVITVLPGRVELSQPNITNVISEIRLLSATPQADLRNSGPAEFVHNLVEVQGPKRTLRFSQIVTTDPVLTPSK